MFERTAEQIAAGQGLLDCYGWYRTDWGPIQDLGRRTETFQAALGLWWQRGGYSIVETGCQRLAYDPGAGMSTMLLCDVVSRCGGHLWSVDINLPLVQQVDQLTAKYGKARCCQCGDSVTYLREQLHPQANFRDHGQIDLLYLDSWDYPYGSLLDLYGGQRDIHEAAAALVELGEAEIVQRHGELIRPSQEHCVLELEAAWHLIRPHSVILIDDNQLPGGGKPRLAKQWLRKRGWHCVLDAYQTLWIAGPAATFPGVPHEPQ